MDYATSYLNATKIAERIRAAASSGKSVRAGGGLAARGNKAETGIAPLSFEETRAKYITLIQDMFVKDEEQLRADTKAYLEDLEPTRPRRNPQRLAASIDEGSLTERDILALTIQAEAGGEGVEGMLATGAVIDNRVKSGSYGNSFRDVIMAPGQFSAWNSVTGYAGGEGGIDMTSIRPTEDAYTVADQILSGQYQSPVGNATHYYNPSVADPEWGERAGGTWQVVGNHLFGYGN